MTRTSHSASINLGAIVKRRPGESETAFAGLISQGRETFNTENELFAENPVKPLSTDIR